MEDSIGQHCKWSNATVNELYMYKHNYIRYEA